MKGRVIAPLTAVLVVLAMLIGSAGSITTSAQGGDGTITVTTTWAPGDEPGETVEVCYAATTDADGTNVVTEGCTSDDTYTATLGPDGLSAGETYFVWEDTGAGWRVTGDNPVEVEIPAGGEASVEFENEQAGDIATITIHKAVCPETSDVLFGDCHEERVPDVNFVIGDDRVATDENGELTTDAPAGEIKITEAEDDFDENATAGAAWVFCAIMPGGDPVLYDDLANHREVQIDAPAGSTVVCDWYNLTAEGPQPATLEIHNRLCQNGPPNGDIFEECHEFLVDQPVSFAVDGGEARFVDDAGNVIFDDLTPGSHDVALVEGPPGDFVNWQTWCSVVGSDALPFSAGDGPGFRVEVGDGQHVICDMYVIPEDLSGLPTNTPQPDEPTNTPAPVIPTSTPAPPTDTPTPVPPTATATPMPFIGRPVFITEGTCGDLDDEPLFDLSGLTTPEADVSGSEFATVVESSYTVIDISLDELLDGDHVINAVIADDDRDFVACGEIGGPVRPDGSLIVGLREAEGSGLSGVAYLSPASGGQTAISIFLAPGLAEEDPNLLPPPDDEVMIHAVVNNGPVDPESQEGYEITIDADGEVTIVITPPGASDDLGNDATEVQEVVNTELSDADLVQLLADLHAIGFFDLTQAGDVNPDLIEDGGRVSALTVTVIDGTWDVSGNGLSDQEVAILDEAQDIVAEAVGGVDQ